MLQLVLDAIELLLMVEQRLMLLRLLQLLQLLRRRRRLVELLRLLLLLRQILLVQVPRAGSRLPQR
jgi:hypothetical protein